MTSGFSGFRHGLFRGLGAGSRVAGYLVEEQIGAGGMAVVFRARDEVLGRLAAVKVIAPSLADDEEFRTRFLRESRAAAAVDSLHIIPVYGAGEADGLLYIATRFVAGGDLAALLRRSGGRLAPGQAVPLVAQVASALDAAHAAGLVHRDVKPHNILIDAMPEQPEHAYLSDFGLSRTTASTSLTASGAFLGTPDYCAPEQVKSARVDGRADQYALGCVAFALLTGTPPFHREETLGTLFAHVQDPVPPVTGLRPELPPAVDAVIARALAKSPDDRYPTCAEFAAALQEALALGHPATVTGPLRWPAGNARSADGLHPRRAGGHDAAPSAGETGTGPGAGSANTITTGNSGAGRDSGAPGSAEAPVGAGRRAKAGSRRVLTAAGGIALLAAVAVVAVLTLSPGHSDPSAASTGNGQPTDSSVSTGSSASTDASASTGSPSSTPAVSAGASVVPSQTRAAPATPTAGTGKGSPHTSPAVQTVPPPNPSTSVAAVQSSSSAPASATTAVPLPATASVAKETPGTLCGGRICYHYSVSVANFPASTVLSYSCGETGSSIAPTDYGTQVASGSTTTDGSGSTSFVTECYYAVQTVRSITVTVYGGGQSASGSVDMSTA